MSLSFKPSGSFLRDVAAALPDMVETKPSLGPAQYRLLFSVGFGILVDGVTPKLISTTSKVTEAYIELVLTMAAFLAILKGGVVVGTKRYYAAGKNMESATVTRKDVDSGPSCAVLRCQTGFDDGFSLDPEEQAVFGPLLTEAFHETPEGAVVAVCVHIPFPTAASKTPDPSLN